MYQAQLKMSVYIPGKGQVIVWQSMRSTRDRVYLFDTEEGAWRAIRQCYPDQQGLPGLFRVVQPTYKIITSDGKFWATRFNEDIEHAEKYFVGQLFERSPFPVTQVEEM